MQMWYISSGVVSPRAVPALPSVSFAVLPPGSAQSHPNPRPPLCRSLRCEQVGHGWQPPASPLYSRATLSHTELTGVLGQPVAGAAISGTVVMRTLGIPLTAQLSVVLYPAITERFTKGWVNLGASEKSCSL